MSLKQLVNNKELWDTYCKDREERKVNLLKKLSVVEPDSFEVGRIQGQIRQLNLDLKLRDEINNDKS